MSISSTLMRLMSCQVVCIVQQMVSVDFSANCNVQHKFIPPICNGSNMYVPRLAHSGVAFGHARNA